MTDREIVSMLIYQSMMAKMLSLAILDERKQFPRERIAGSFEEIAEVCKDAAHWAVEKSNIPHDDIKAMLEMHAEYLSTFIKIQE